MKLFFTHTDFITTMKNDRLSFRVIINLTLQINSKWHLMKKKRTKINETTNHDLIMLGHLSLLNQIIACYWLLILSTNCKGTLIHLGVPRKLITEDSHWEILRQPQLKSMQMPQRNTQLLRLLPLTLDPLSLPSVLSGSTLLIPVSWSTHTIWQRLHLPWLWNNITLSHFTFFLNVAKCNLGFVNHVSMHPGLPWNLPALPCIFARPPPTFDANSSKAHVLTMSLSILLLS